jgi:hypothetical protein
MSKKTEAPTTPLPPARPVRATYHGLRLLQKGGVGHTWMFQGDTELKVYKKNLATAAIGEIWEFKVDDQGSVYVGGDNRPVRVGTHDNAAEVSAWEAQSATQHQLYREEKAGKALANRGTMLERQCEPLARMYNSLRGIDDRDAFLRAVARAIRRSK